jgi:hypothetical protein
LRDSVGRWDHEGMANHDTNLKFRISSELADALRETAAYYNRSEAAELRTAVGLYLRLHSLEMLKDPAVQAEQGDDLPRVRLELEESLEQWEALAWRRPATPGLVI